MKYIALFGMAGGAILAAGKLTAAQWHAAGAGLLALVLAHGLTLLPWMLVALLAWRYWWWKRHALLYEQMVVDEQVERQRRGAEIWDLKRQLERKQARRKRPAPR